MNSYAIVNGELSVEPIATKTYADLKRVFEAGKPTSVIEQFAAMYLAGLDPDQDLKDEWYALHAEILALDDITATATRPLMALDENGNEVTVDVVVKQGRELTEDEQAQRDELAVKRSQLEDGYTIPAIYELDEEGNPTAVEQAPEREVAGTPWLKTLRGAGTDPVPEFTPADPTAFIASAFPELRKDARDAAVAAIDVTISTGKTFDGDEKSQDRMARAVAVGDPGDTTYWKLADNTVAEVTWEELREALLAAGQAQTVIWVA